MKGEGAAPENIWISVKNASTPTYGITRESEATSAAEDAAKFGAPQSQRVLSNQWPGNGRQFRLPAPSTPAFPRVGMGIRRCPSTGLRVAGKELWVRMRRSGAPRGQARKRLETEVFHGGILCFGMRSARCPGGFVKTCCGLPGAEVVRVGTHV